MSLAARLWLWMTAVLAVLVIAEFGLRAAVPRLDPARQFRMIDGVGSSPTLAPQDSLLRQTSVWGEYDLDVSIGHYGLRETKPIIAAGDNAIFVVGDQFAFGQGVQEQQRFSNELEMRLGVPVYNISMRGILPWGHFKLVSYVEQIVRYARNSEFKIQHLLVVISLPQDVKRYDDLEREQPSHHAVVPGSTFEIERSPIDWLLKETAIGLGLRIAVYKRILSREHGILSALNLYDAVQRMRAGVSSPQRAAEAAVDGEAVHQTVTQLVKMATLRNVIFVVMPPPGTFLDDRSSIKSEIHDKIIAELARSKLSYVDVMPALVEARKTESVLFRHAEQWNVSAHVVTAQAVASAAKEKWMFVKQ